MNQAIDFAKYIMKQNRDAQQDTFDGNKKLQKLLFFATLVSYATNKKPLFDDKFHAYDHGCVVEPVRLRYKNDFQGMLEDSKNYNPVFTQEEYETLNTTLNIFGELSAKELSELNHKFSCWKTYQNSDLKARWRYKKDVIIPDKDIKADSELMKPLLEAFEQDKSSNVSAMDVINGISFYYNPTEVIMNEDLITKLSEFAFLEREDNAYTIYYDEGELVIY